MAKVTYQDRPYRSFVAAVPANLVGQEGMLVELIPGTNTIQLYNAGIPLGVLLDRLEGSTAWNVRLIGGGGTLRGIAGGAINPPAYVKASAGGTMVAGNSADKCLGIAIFPYQINQGDIIEVVDDRCIMP